ncbi:MAG: epoxide hydrolase, partial [Anaerolineae bacterium]|nr:epoxide hydrolase [Anaerolineae bacterium]
FIPFGEVTAEELATFTEAEKTRLERRNTFMSDRNGYFQIQATRPQTLAYGLTDSPVGQLAWIVEKFKEWTDSSASRLEDAVDRDQMLTDVMFYWLTGTAGSSARLYYENMHSGAWGQAKGPTPTGVAVFAEDLPIRRYAEWGNNIVHWSEFDRGGHFAAMEVPDLLVGDIRKFFSQVLPA